MAQPADTEPYLPSLEDDWLTKPSIGELKIKEAIEKLRAAASSQKTCAKDL